MLVDCTLKFNECIMLSDEYGGKLDICCNTIHWEKKVSWHLLFTLSRTVQFVPEVEHTALEKVRATKQQNETTPGN